MIFMIVRLKDAMHIVKNNLCSLKLDNHIRVMLVMWINKPDSCNLTLCSAARVVGILQQPKNCLCIRTEIHKYWK